MRDVGADTMLAPSLMRSVAREIFAPQRITRNEQPFYAGTLRPADLHVAPEMGREPLSAWPVRGAASRPDRVGPLGYRRSDPFSAPFSLAMFQAPSAGRPKSAGEAGH
jgi:hypothetical protein